MHVVVQYLVRKLERDVTILREAEEAMFARGLDGREQEFLDSLHVMEVGMRHFFAKAIRQDEQNEA